MKYPANIFKHPQKALHDKGVVREVSQDEDCVNWLPQIFSLSCLGMRDDFREIDGTSMVGLVVVLLDVTKEAFASQVPVNFVMAQEPLLECLLHCVDIFFFNTV